MRLGHYKAILDPNSKVAKAYQKDTIEERHRHRYEVNDQYHAQLSKIGDMKIS